MGPEAGGLSSGRPVCCCSPWFAEGGLAVPAPLSPASASKGTSPRPRLLPYHHGIRRPCTPLGGSRTGCPWHCLPSFKCHIRPLVQLLMPVPWFRSSLSLVCVISLLVSLYIYVFLRTRSSCNQGDLEPTYWPSCYKALCVGLCLCVLSSWHPQQHLSPPQMLMLTVNHRDSESQSSSAGRGGPPVSFTERLQGPGQRLMSGWRLGE